MQVSLTGLKQYASDFVDALPQRHGEHAYIVGLKGELGAGKTTFVQAVAHKLGVEESVTSPTFVIAQSYNTQHPVFTTLVHIDAYRLAEENKDTIGFVDIQNDPHALVLVEWPEHLPGGMPKHTNYLSFETVNETTRKITHVS